VQVRAFALLLVAVLLDEGGEVLVRREDGLAVLVGGVAEEVGQLVTGARDRDVVRQGRRTAAACAVEYPTDVARVDPELP
jgi:predicted NAD/FAD-binding protein